MTTDADVDLGRHAVCRADGRVEDDGLRLHEVVGRRRGQPIDAELEGLAGRRRGKDAGAEREAVEDPEIRRRHEHREHGGLALVHHGRKGLATPWREGIRWVIGVVAGTREGEAVEVHVPAHLQMGPAPASEPAMFQ
jgi:hypothetical protein